MQLFGRELGVRPQAYSSVPGDAEKQHFIMDTSGKPHYQLYTVGSNAGSFHNTSRAAGKDHHPNKEEMSPMRKLFATVLVIFFWYMSNIAVLIGNKYLLSHTSFRQPVFLTMCHMIACSCIGYAISATKLMPAKPITSLKQLVKVTLLAAIFCLTIVLGNVSLKFIPVSFNQAIGATTPVFTAIFAFLLQGSKETAWTYATLAPIAVGIILASGGEPMFHLIGFSTALLACSGRALKSVVQSMLMTDPAEKLDAMSLLMYMSSICVVMLLPAASILEPGSWALFHSLVSTDSTFVWGLVTNCLLAYAVNLTNFLVTKYTSALTLQVLGNAKGVVAAAISIWVFSNPVTVTGALGYALATAGVFLYSESKRRAKLAKERLAKERADQDAQALLKEKLLRADSGSDSGGHDSGDSSSENGENEVHVVIKVRQ